MDRLAHTVTDTRVLRQKPGVRWDILTQDRPEDGSRYHGFSIVQHVWHRAIMTGTSASWHRRRTLYACLLYCLRFVPLRLFLLPLALCLFVVPFHFAH